MTPLSDQSIRITSIRVPFDEILALVFKVWIATLMVGTVLGIVAAALWYVIGSSFRQG